MVKRWARALGYLAWLLVCVVICAHSCLLLGGYVFVEFLRVAQVLTVPQTSANILSIVLSWKMFMLDGAVFFLVIDILALLMLTWTILELMMLKEE